jgi:YgiT-type zinc finger domain-containing protein
LKNGRKTLKQEGDKMVCCKCGNEMVKRKTDLPFKLADQEIVVVKDVPVFICSSCGEILIEDEVMKKLEIIFTETKGHRELEVVRYAA